jgi:hypothetical protein
MTTTEKKTRNSVTSGLGDALGAELEAAAKITGQSKAELVRVVFETHAPSRQKIAEAYLNRQKKAIEAQLAGLAAAAAPPLPPAGGGED